MKIVRSMLVISVLALVLSLLFFGVQLPVSEFTGCYIDKAEQDKLCINPDISVVQFSLNNGKWDEYHQSTWTAIAMKEIIGHSNIIKFESAIENGELKKNVVVQPYMGVLRQVRISFGNEANKAEDGVIYNLVD